MSKVNSILTDDIAAAHHILTNGAGSAEDDNTRISSVLPSTLASYRWNQPNAMRISIDISCREGNR